MKFLLVALNAKYIHSNPAVYSLRAYAGQEFAENIDIAEYTINQNIEDILEDIVKRKPDVIGFSCYIWNISMISHVVPELKKILKEVPIWLGGPEVSFPPYEKTFDLMDITGIMCGEGENTFLKLLEFYKKNNSITERSIDLPAIEGIVTKDRQILKLTETDISKVPFIYNDMSDFENRIVYYESQRGCPFSCSYCLSSIDKHIRMRDMKLVYKELDFFLKNNVPQVKFIDRTFNAISEHAKSIWKYIIEHDNGVTNFHFEISADILKKDEIKLLNSMRPGLVQLEIGVQSFNEKTLRAVNRFTDLKVLSENVKKLRKMDNINIHLDLIAGLPYEDFESFKQSFDMLYELNPDQLQLGFLKVLKGSPIYSMKEEYDIAYADYPPYEVLYTKWISYEEIRRLKKVEEMVEIYYNSNQFTHTLKVLVKAFDTPYLMFEALADFYEKNGLFMNTPKRGYRYDVLLLFALEYDKNNKELYKELLTYDVYARENAKKRPEFSSDIYKYGEQIRKFYISEQKDRKFLPLYGKYDSHQMQRMTHLEPFNYRVWDMELLKNYSCVEELSNNGMEFVLFDYQYKNPVNHEAKVVSNLHFN